MSYIPGANHPWHKYYLNKKINHPKFCIDCNNQISPNPNNNRCHNCAAKLRPQVFKRGIRPSIETEFKFGKEHPRWQGGVKVLSQAVRHLKKSLRWREEILIRDNYTCQLCYSDEKRKLEADHFPKTLAELLVENNIHSTREANENTNFWELQEGRTLCNPCHRKTLTYGGRIHAL